MVEVQGGSLEKFQVKIGGMQCSFCSGSIEKAFRQIDGVDEASVSLAHEETLVQYDSSRVAPEQLKKTLVSMGYSIRDPNLVRAFEEQQEELGRAQRHLLVAAVFTLAGLGLMAYMWFRMGIYAEGTFTDAKEPWMGFTALGFALATMFWPAWHIKTMAWASLRRGILNQHVLLEFGAFAGLLGGALGLSTLYSSAMEGFLGADFPIVHFFVVAVFVTGYHILSEWTSLLVRTRTSRSVQKLMNLQPATARAVRDGREEEAPVEDLRVGDLVRVRPGESIPVDGVVTEGRSGVDQSLVTGESMPVEKVRDDEVIGGSLNQTGTVLVRVTHVGAESFLQQVAQHIQEARALKPGIIILVDRVLKYFVPAVLAASALGFVIWTAGAWLVTGEANLNRAIFAALAALVMGYPCALGMATPLAMIRGGGIAARKGILMRSGEAFQTFKDVRKVVLDKTGTITEGKPTVSAVAPVPGVEEAALLSLAASVEASSEHPLGRAILEHALEQGSELASSDDFQAHAGRGVEARVQGRRVLVGTARFLQEQGVDAGGLRERQAELEEQGQTVVLVAADGEALALIAVGDTLKEDARETVQRLRDLGLEPVMITGDNWRTANAVAGQVGIEEVLAEVLPQDKANEVRKLQQQGYRVAMVGDGINDAPALMQADVGVAIGTGTDIAIDSADVILVGNRLGGLVDAYHIGKSSFTKTVQNVSIAFAFNGIGVPAAMTGVVHPIYAMIAMAASVALVLANSFAGRVISLPRLRAARPEPRTRTLTLRVPTIHCEECVEAEPGHGPQRPGRAGGPRQPTRGGDLPWRCDD